MQVFGVSEWKSEGQLRTRHGLRDLFTAQSNERFESAWSGAHEALYEIGFDGSYGGWIKWWRKPVKLDVAHIEQVCREAEVAGIAYAAEMVEWRASEVRAREAAIQAEADAREAAKVAALARPGILLGQIRELVRDWLWLFTPEHAECAVKLAQVDPLVNMWLAEDLIGRARKTLKRIHKRLSEPTDEQLLALCQSPAVRQAVHAACKMLSRCDEDRAAQSNGIGWSKATTTTGHYLSRLPTMSPAQAAHGTRLLTVHRKQLPLAMAAAIFHPERKLETIEMTERKTYAPTRKPWSPVAPRPVETPAEMEARYAKEEADWHFITAGIVPPQRITPR